MCPRAPVAWSTFGRSREHDRAVASHAAQTPDSGLFPLNGASMSHFITVDFFPPAAYSHVATAGDAFYGRGSTLSPKGFLNDGVPYPKIVAVSILFRKMTFFVKLRHAISYSSRCDLIFAEVEFSVRGSSSEKPQESYGEPLS